MPKYFIYPIYTTVLALIAIAIMPRKEIHGLAIYGIFFGGVIDMFIILLAQFTGIGGFINYGPFGFLNIPFFPPIAWTIFFIMYLYILPKHKICAYIYAFVAAVYAIVFSSILKNLGIFKWNYISIILPFILYASWFTAVTWAYFRLTENISEDKHTNSHVLKIHRPKNKTVPNIVSTRLEKPRLWTRLKRIFWGKRVK